jgi:hypothetical protein
MGNVIDRFNRPDTAPDAGTLGIADTGQVWQQSSVAHKWQISNNQAGRPNGAGNVQSQAWVNAGIGDAWTEVTLAGAGGGYIGLVGRVLDDFNHILIQCLIGNTMYAYIRTGGGYTNLGLSGTGAPAYGDRIGMRVFGSTLIVYRNGIASNTLNLGANSHHTRTGWGLYNYTGGANKLDDFAVKVPAKVWNGSAWVSQWAKTWDGALWKPRAVRRWDGVAWI